MVAEGADRLTTSLVTVVWCKGEATTQSPVSVRVRYITLHYTAPCPASFSFSSMPDVRIDTECVNKRLTYN